MGKSEQERLAQKIARLQSEMVAAEKKLKEQQRKDDTRRKILAGALCLKACLDDPELRAKMHKILSEGLTQDHERKLFGDFDLPPLNSQQQSFNDAALPPLPEDKASTTKPKEKVSSPLIESFSDAR
jgi:hypothetical protein